MHAVVLNFQQCWKRLDKTLLSTERQKAKAVFLQIACLQSVPVEILFFDVMFVFFTNVRSGLSLEDVGCRNIWRCDSALTWIVCYFTHFCQLND